MKMAGGLTFVTGPMGSGKSLFGTRKIVSNLAQGKYVLSNIALLPGWEQKAARHLLRFSPLSWGKERELSEKLRSRYIFLESIEDATFFELPEKGGMREGVGTLVWDEVHNDLNNREWMESSQKLLTKWATQLRKLRFEAYFLTQHADNTDVALRRICNYHVHLQNQREQTRLLGMRVTPWPLFLAIWYPANVKLIQRTKPILVERYFLDWHRHLYDTLSLYHGLHAEYQANTKVFKLPDGGVDEAAIAAWKIERRKERAMRDANANTKGAPPALVSMQFPQTRNLRKAAG